ncbi:tyrosyl-DNA phosphodiesterase 1 isoform X2 [Cyclopterus lumpus]|uniref:tyrosyl-DNA phosphodiesterase 1 isoform X2 n=1 Tax=Cyclopterus lumpus TaxID=8103 RepID=UPI00148681EF|nr:tyrosyl-DNA phosphodiesterase 1 isoform X2 [Cyclopterus lumpus]
MSQDSHHGKWTISSSDDDDEAVPLSGTTTSEPRRPAASGQGSHRPASPQSPRLEAATVDVKPEPADAPVSSLADGSEAGRPASTDQLNASKYETSPSLAGKRKKEALDGSGWALSDSDDDDGDVKGKSLGKRAPPSPKTKKPKVETERPPSPHGRLYYIDEPEDFFESSIPRLSDTYRFYLNKVTGLDRKYNSGALHIRDILSPLFGTLKESAQFNYCFDIAWMVKQYPSEFRDRPVLIVHGDKREAKARLLQQAKPFPHIHFCQAKLDIAFGTHHTKMMLLWYEEGFRVIILTSNLIRADWYQKTQGMWMSPVFPRLPEGSGESAGESPTSFKRDLLEYLASYRAPELEEWIRRIGAHDLSEARVYLVGSTPGRYVGSDMERWGHLRLRKLLYDHADPVPGEERWPVIGQFSSIGSMGLDKTKWLTGEFQRTMTTLGKSSLRSDPPMHLVYPSVEDVRTSLEGYPAGGSLPYSIQTAQKQLWLHSFFHRWKATATGRSHAMPHIKTYMRASPDFTELAWFLVTRLSICCTVSVPTCPKQPGVRWRRTAPR